MKKPQCNATIRIEGIDGLYCCTLKKDHEFFDDKVSHIFEVLWTDYEKRIVDVDFEKRSKKAIETAKEKKVIQ